MTKTHLRALGAGRCSRHRGHPCLCTRLGEARARTGAEAGATVQLLSFNDYHGHLEATDGPLSKAQDPSQTPVGGAEYLSSKLSELRTRSATRRA